MAQELELKLCLTIEAAETLAGASLFAGPSKTIAQRSIYFDTADLELIETGLCLRIREADGRFIQTLKGDSQPGAGLFARSEDDVAVTGEDPQIAPDSPIAALIGNKPLLALFEVRNERRLWNLSAGSARIEAALDFGHVVAGDRYSPYVELELELKRGKASALFELGRSILALAPLRLGVVSKAERGYRLLGPLASRHRAEPISLEPGITIGQAFPRIAGACLRHYLLNAELLQDGRRADARATLAVHQSRVALRRLRAAILVFRPLLRADDDTRRIDQGIGRLARVLGEARDLDVLIEKRAVDGGGQDQASAWLKADAARLAAHERVRRTLVSRETTELLFDVIEWLSEGVWSRASELEDLRNTPCSALAVDALRHYRRRVRRLGKRFGELDDDKRHQLRKDFKTLRYAAEFFAPLFVDERRKRERETFVTTLEAVQDRLGDWNDYVTGPRVAAGLGLQDAGSRVTAAELVQEMEQGAALLKAAQRALRDFSRARRFWPQQGRAGDPAPEPTVEASDEADEADEAAGGAAGQAAEKSAEKPAKKSARKVAEKPSDAQTAEGGAANSGSDRESDHRPDRDKAAQAAWPEAADAVLSGAASAVDSDSTGSGAESAAAPSSATTPAEKTPTAKTPTETTPLAEEAESTRPAGQAPAPVPDAAALPTGVEAPSEVAVELAGEGAKGAASASWDGWPRQGDQRAGAEPAAIVPEGEGQGDATRADPVDKPPKGRSRR